MKAYFLSALHPRLPLALRGTPEGDVGWVDWEQGRVLRHLATGQAGLKAVALHEDGQRAATLGQSDLKVWQAERLLATHSLENGHNLRFCGENLLVGQPGLLKAMDPVSGTVIWEKAHEGFLNPSLLASDDKSLAWSAMGASEVLVLEPATGVMRNLFTVQGEIFAVGLHPDGARLVASLTGSGNSVMQSVQIWSLNTGLPERKFSVPFQSVAVAVSPDGCWVATGDSRGAQLWDYAHGAPERRFALREEANVPGLGQIERPRAGLVTAIRFAPERLITDGDELSVWHLENGQREWCLEVMGVDV